MLCLKTVNFSLRILREYNFFKGAERLACTPNRTLDNFFDAAQQQKDKILVLNDLGFLKTPRKQTW